MSGQLAEVENCNIPPDMANRRDRIDEIRSLNGELGAISVLDNIRVMVKWTDDAISPSSRPSYYLIKYESTGTVTIEPHYTPILAVESYDAAELELMRRDGEASYANVAVLVVSEKFDMLKRAYPNYFGDVQVFKQHLARVVAKDTREHAIVLQERVPSRPPLERASLAWLRRRFRWS
jgi:hypothetical protein